MIEIRREPKRVFAVIEPTDPLSYVAQVIQEAHIWFLGHGLSSFSVVRSKGQSGRNCVLDIVSLYGEPKLLAFSAPTTLNDLRKEKYFPETLPEHWQVEEERQGRQHINIVGQFRYGLDKDHGGTVLVTKEMRPELTLAEYSYGVSDIIAGWLCRGSQKCKHHGSIAEAQTWIDVGMDQQEIEDYFANPYDYKPDMKVGDIPQFYVRRSFKNP